MTAKRLQIISLMLAIALLMGGCGRSAAPPPPSYPSINVYVQEPLSLASLPLAVAQKLGLYANQHIRVKWVSHPQNASLWVETAGRHYPILGLVAQKPDAVLVAPRSDPHFRLRSLNHMPVAYSSGAMPWLPIISSIFKVHRVVPSSLDTIPIKQMAAVWRDYELPWAVVTLSEWQTLQKEDPKTSVLAWMGGATGPIPAIVITGKSPLALPFVSAVNLALWYINTSSARAVAPLAQNANIPITREIELIRLSQKYQLWPATVVVSRSVYQRQVSLLGVQSSWPSYDNAVNRTVSNEAINRLPG
ncbi:MAG: hypothetical protein M1499_00865 [Firmicutes bacterium]|nr:hypothetical protein [Bacillota bacterium]MCL5971099.1 hypothetical protein [Bacillota bacterium]